MTEAFTRSCVGRMCHGEEGRLFVQLFGSNKILELDCSSSRFTSNNTISTGLGYCRRLCYIPVHDYLVVSGFGEILAVSCDDRSVVWRVEGKEIDPRGLILCNDMTVVADTNGRILFLNPTNGSCIQILNLPNVDRIYQLGLRKDHIVVLHRVDNKYKISFLDIL